MKLVRRMLRLGLQPLEHALGTVFTAAWNPMQNLGALGFFFYWIVAVSGIYIYIFFDTGISEAYGSVEYMTHEQWYLAGVMRSLHRYASDGLVLIMVLHLLREFALDRYRGVRWFSWFTGVPILVFVFVSGITGYWLVWDELAQFIAVLSAKWLDWLPIFGEPIGRNFLTPASLDDRFFTLMVFMHIVVPLFLLIILWIHLQRVSRPRINPPRGLAIGTFAMLMALSLVLPATSHGPADLTSVPAVIALDWFYLGLYPLIDHWSSGTVWATVAVLTLIMAGLPWLPPLKRAPAAVVHLDFCNGCGRCVEDCPYTAISLQARTDGLSFENEAVVNTDLCVSCGICAGACPSSTPFRRVSDIVTGIDLPQLTIDDLRARVKAAAGGLTGEPRILVFGCAHDDTLRSVQEMANVAAVDMPCIAMLPPAFIDYALARAGVDGVLLSGCPEGACVNRLGMKWTGERIAGTRDPYLRKRVPRERIVVDWAVAGNRRRMVECIEDFAERLQGMEDSIPKGARLQRTGSDG